VPRVANSIPDPDVTPGERLGFDLLARRGRPGIGVYMDAGMARGASKMPSLDFLVLKSTCTLDAY
jgi:hypothetical protein